MKLISTSNLSISSWPKPPPQKPYAIVSHTWNLAEKNSPELNGSSPRSKTSPAGDPKVEAVADLLRKEHATIEYFWMDTWSVDKWNPPELSESLISMFGYYAGSVLCMVYLDDFDSVSGLRACKWFTRGWTLLELLAPKEVIFYDRKWKKLGTKLDLKEELGRITGIPSDALLNRRSLNEFSVAQRMSWASKRDTSREEDKAYCLMGIFQVQISVQYGEGLRRAFRRLQEEIIRRSSDLSILAWKSKPPSPTASLEPVGPILAESPEAFQGCGNIVLYDAHQPGRLEITNKGLKMELTCTSCQAQKPADRDDLELIAFLGCAERTENREVYPIGIRLASEDGSIYQRVHEQPNGLVTVTRDQRPVSWNREVHAQMLHTKDMPTLRRPPIFYRIESLPGGFELWKAEDSADTPISLPLEAKLFPYRERSAAVFIIATGRRGRLFMFKKRPQPLCALIVQADFDVPRVVVDVRTNLDAEFLPGLRVRNYTDYVTEALKSYEVIATVHGSLSNHYRHKNFVVKVEIRKGSDRGHQKLKSLSRLFSRGRNQHWFNAPQGIGAEMWEM